jgi:hypothetical protein
MCPADLLLRRPALLAKYTEIGGVILTETLCRDWSRQESDRVTLGVPAPPAPVVGRPSGGGTTTSQGGGLMGVVTVRLGSN